MPPEKGAKAANVKKNYLKCQYFFKTRAFFSKKRAYFFLNCHFTENRLLLHSQCCTEP